MNEIAFLRGEDLPQRPENGPGSTLDTELDLSPVVGTWANADDGDSGGIFRLIVRERAGRLWIRSFGASSPEPRAWDEVEGIAYAANPASRLAWGFTVTYDFGFLETTIVAYVKSGVLVTTTYNAFRDGSGRADYWTREFFHR